jgi:hypothetical protein
MNKILDSFSTRETALLAWIGIALVLCLFNKGIRTSLVGVVKALFANKIILSLLAFFSHTAFYVLILTILGLWDIALLKDTVFWALGFGFVALVNINKVNSKAYFKETFKDAVKGTILIEFIANFFTFSLLAELIILPIVVIAAMMQAVASFKEEHKPVENFIKNLFLYFSIFVFLFSLYKTVASYREVFTFDNFKSLMLPVVLTITFLPFMYLFNLYVKYEMLWVTLKFMIRDKAERKKVKRQILWVANFNVDKLVSITKNIAKPVNVYNDTSLEMVKRISKGSYIGNDENDY